MSAAWEVPPPERDQARSFSGDSAPLVSLHFLLGSLRERWVLCSIAALAGLLVAGASLVLLPPPDTASATIVLAHEPDQDAARAVSTDLSLLRTRTVADRTLAELGVTMPADAFLGAFSVEPKSDEVVVLRLGAPSPSEAVRRLDALTRVYLDFRAEQISRQADILVEEMTARIETLRGEAERAEQRITALSAADRETSPEFSDALADRARFSGQIDSLQESVQETSLKKTAVVAASRVVDPAAADLHGWKRRAALVLLTGLIGGSALGAGFVLFRAVTTDRLRRRYDIAQALEVPVAVSTGPLAPLPRRLGRLPLVRRWDARRSEDRRRVARVLADEVDGRSALAVACVDRSDDVRHAVVAAGLLLSQRGLEVSLIDLTRHGRVQDALAAQVHTAPAIAPVVLRPVGPAALTRRSEDLRRASGPEEVRDPDSLGPGRVALVLADLDPGVGADNLAAFADRAVVAVTAGASSAERVRTAGDLLRTARLEPVTAVLLRADPRDYSSGQRPLTGLPAGTS